MYDFEEGSQEGGGGLMEAPLPPPRVADGVLWVTWDSEEGVAKLSIPKLVQPKLVGPRGVRPRLEERVMEERVTRLVLGGGTRAEVSRGEEGWSVTVMPKEPVAAPLTCEITQAVMRCASQRRRALRVR